MILNTGDAKVEFTAENQTISFSGSMRLANMKEYDEVGLFLNTSAENIKSHLLLDFSKLQFLNSSGITTLSLFVLACKKTGSPKLIVKGNKSISWQQKSLANLKKLWPEVDLDL